MQESEGYRMKPIITYITFMITIFCINIVSLSVWNYLDVRKSMVTMSDIESHIPLYIKGKIYKCNRSFLLEKANRKENKND